MLFEPLVAASIRALCFCRSNGSGGGAVNIFASASGSSLLPAATLMSRQSSGSATQVYIMHIVACCALELDALRDWLPLL